ncbi:hypothetical protein cypCar_00035749, partial [Cyprinus carpio]
MLFRERPTSRHHNERRYRSVLIWISPYLIEPGKNVTFKTTITSTQDFLTITWNFNKNSVISPIITNVLVTNTNNIDKKYAGRIIYSNTTCELQLGPLVKEDEGEYNLNIVTSKGESLSGQIDLEVLEALSGTHISSSSSVLIAGNSTVNITCSAAAGKAESVEWLKDSKSVASSDRIVLSADKNTLTIVKVVKEDAGNYTCQLKNKVNKDESTYVMVINYGPESVKIEGKKAVKFEELAELKCSADSVPPSIFSWKLNDTAMNSSQAVIIITKASVKNSGTYTCKAFNPITGMTKTLTHNLAVTEVGTVDEGLSGGAIAGIVIAVLVAVIILACIIKCKKKSGT